MTVYTKILTPPLGISEQTYYRWRKIYGGLKVDQAKKLRNELLDGEIFYGVKEAQALVNQWVRHYNTTRPHSSLGYMPPAPEVRVNLAIQDLQPMTH